MVTIFSTLLKEGPGEPDGDANDVHLFSGIINTTKENTEVVFDAIKKACIEVTADMLLSRHTSAGQNHNTKIDNRSFMNLTQFKYLRTTITNQKIIQKKLNMKSIASNVFYLSVLEPFAFSSAF
jgi:hypothetical protein